MEMILISLCLTTFLAFLILKPLFKRITTTKLKLPPSPWRLPVIGNLHQLGLNPHRSLHSLSLRYGPLMLLHFGRVPVLVVSCPDVTNDIMKTHDLKFSNRPKSKAINIFMDGGRDIIFGPYGEDWKSMKSLGVVHLLNNKMVRSFENLREEEIKVMTEKLEEASLSSSSVNLSKLIMTLTNDIICRVTLGRKYNIEEGGIDIKNLVMTSSEYFGKFFFGDFIPSLAWIDWISGIDDKMKDINNKLDVFLDSMVQEHVDADHKEPSDFVDMLLLIQKDKTKRFQFDRSDLILILKDMFFSGTATTASQLEWTMTELMRHPECMKKLQDEINSFSTHNLNVTEKEVEKMNYLHCVIKEGLRLHPSGPLVSRLPSEDVQLKGYNISAGTHVILNVWALQRNPAIWGLDANEYRPERHFGTNLDFNGTDSKFVPFGGGRRLCPGIGFSLAMSKLALANLVKRFNWRLEVGPAGDDKPDLAEASGIDVCRKFPLIVFPSIVHPH
ncbi:Cytochrome P450 superfamily [Arabidopsis suecica]|uniref:Cytochrome P450 superfamily n=1 Tax=Arabidopsis suecica TaxID=45249 RepID=A0A8T1YLQ0_ARASU|nr:Cytochrome P450 superfamily [Arabidopsis suecica]